MGQTPPSLAQLTATQRESANTPAARESNGEVNSYKELVDITASTGIQFEHLPGPEQEFIVESMSGCVALIDTNRDGWDKAEVFWRDGKVETLTNLAANRSYSVREGAGTGLSPPSPFQGRSQAIVSVPAITGQPERRALPPLDEAS